MLVGDKEMRSESVPVSLLEQWNDIWKELTDIIQKQGRILKDVGGRELLLSWWCVGLRSWCPTSQNFWLSNLEDEDEGAKHPVTVPSLSPPLIFVVIQQSRVFWLSLCLSWAPILPGVMNWWWERRVSKHWVLWSFPPPVISVRCMRMQPDTLLPRRTLGDLGVLPYRGDQPLRLLPEVLSLQASHLELHHQYLKHL